IKEGKQPEIKHIANHTFNKATNRKNHQLGCLFLRWRETFSSSLGIEFDKTGFCPFKLWRILYEHAFENRQNIVCSGIGNSRQ
ncbi:MAG: hypothetical protein ACPLSK_05180, partial [bacterium]